MSNPSIEARLEKIANDGNFRKVWSRIKDVIIKDKNLDKDDKLTLAKLYKDFDSGLTTELKKFEKATSTNAATKHAQRAIVIIKDYEQKFEAVQRDLPAVTSMGLGGLLEGLRKYLEKSLNEIGSDDMGATVKIKQLANDAKLHKVWSKIKDSTLKNKDLDKDDKKALTKLYDKFDSGLTDAIKKFEQASSDEEAIKYAEQAIEITKDYAKKVKEAKNLPGQTPLLLGGLLAELQKYLEGWVKELA